MEHAVILSILICHLHKRREALENLLGALKTQCVGKPVEVLVNGDDGTKAVGEKRNELLQRARGEYISYVDDDDGIPEYYVDEILKAVAEKPDCVGMSGKVIAQKNEAMFKHSIRYAGWYDADGVFYRTPNHLNPVRRELALQTQFIEESSFGEDTDYSVRLRPLLYTEVYIDRVMYFYYPQARGLH